MGITTLLVGAIGVRVWFMVSAPETFLGFSDSGQYMGEAAVDIFANGQHPAGYPFFLRLIHHLSDGLSFTIAVQHATGVAAGLLLYETVRRTGAPSWVGLLPAAVAFFGGTGLFLEHSLLADSLLDFLQVVGVYFVIRALYNDHLRWSLLAGLAIGLSFWVKTVAISSGILIPIILLCGAPGGFRHRLLRAFTVAITVVGMILVYVGVQYYFTGYLGYERGSAWNLYGRVATFVNCERFIPPSGTRFLCPSQSLRDRPSPAYYLFSPNAPAVKRFGGPLSHPTSANAVLLKFSTAAIEHEPVAYAEAIARGLGFYIFPRNGEGSTPQGIREAVTKPLREEFYPAIALFYPNSPHSAGPHSALGPLSVYERYTRVEGPLLILLLACALAGPFFLPRQMRWAAITFTFTALCSITLAIASLSYDARYAYPTFGMLAAGAALGAWGIGTSLARAFRRRGLSPSFGRP